MTQKIITWKVFQQFITNFWLKIKERFTNKIESIKVNGAVQPINSDKSINITIPAQKTKLSEFTNDKEFITKVVNDLDNYYSKIAANDKFITKSVNNLEHYYKKAEVDSKLSAIPKFKIEVVTKLPTTGISETMVYLLKNAKGEDSNLYTEYIYVNGKWEKLGEQRVDLSGYLKEDRADQKYAMFNGDPEQEFAVKELLLGKNSEDNASIHFDDTKHHFAFNFHAGTAILDNRHGDDTYTIAYIQDIPEPVNEAEMQQLFNSLD